MGFAAAQDRKVFHSIRQQLDGCAAAVRNDLLLLQGDVGPVVGDVLQGNACAVSL